MDQFIDDTNQRQNYFTQDEAGDSRLATLGKNKKRNRVKNESGMTSQDEDVMKKNFTPGRIRASRMG